MAYLTSAEDHKRIPDDDGNEQISVQRHAGDSESFIEAKNENCG